MTKTEQSQSVAVLGAGSWGTALALLLARNGLPVYLWGHDEARMATMAHERKNSRYLPDFPFPDNLYVRSDLTELIDEVSRVLVVVPSHVFRATLEAIKPKLKNCTLKIVERMPNSSSGLPVMSTPLNTFSKKVPTMDNRPSTPTPIPSFPNNFMGLEKYFNMNLTVIKSKTTRKVRPIPYFVSPN